MIRAGGSIYYQPAREDGNADNGIQGFGGTFGAISNALSNGSLLPGEGWLYLLRSPDRGAATDHQRPGGAHRESSESDSLLLQPDSGPRALFRRLELHD